MSVVGLFAALLFADLPTQPRTRGRQSCTDRTGQYNSQYYAVVKTSAVISTCIPTAIGSVFNSRVVLNFDIMSFGSTHSKRLACAVCMPTKFDVTSSSHFSIIAQTHTCRQSQSQMPVITLPTHRLPGEDNKARIPRRRHQHLYVRHARFLCWCRRSGMRV